MNFYIEVGPDDIVRQVARLPENDGVGPPMPCPVDNPDCVYRLLETLPDWGNPPSRTSALKWNDGAPAWIDVTPLTDVADRAIAAIDAAGDAARLSVSPPGRDLEYQRAEAQARPYAAAGYPDPAPPCVASWAAAKRWTNDGEPWTGQQAADDIIATADRWNVALEGIRALRLNAKEQVRATVAAAGAPADVEAIAAQFTTDLSNLMKGLA